MTILRLSSPSPWFASVSFDTSPSVTAADYVVTRQDGGASTLAVTHVFRTDAATVVVTFSEPLNSSFVYQLSYQSGPQISLSYRQPLPTSSPSNFEDPEAEAFGVDIDWFAESLSASGDVPTIRGRQCLINDLAAIALIEKGELYHRPDAGAGMKTRVNGPNVPQVLSNLRGSLIQEWAKDDRIRPNGITLTTTATSLGAVTASAKIQTVALEDPISVKTPNGNS